jgi:diacylglycerol kinase (ATP)
MTAADHCSLNPRPSLLILFGYPRSKVVATSCMVKPGATGIRRLVNAVFYSLDGLKAAWRNEAAFRQECVATALLAPLAFWLGQDALERSVLLGVCVLMVVAELLNSAIEAVVDRVGTDHHELSGRAKDFGSAAVFVSVVLVCVVWGLFLWQRLI